MSADNYTQCPTCRKKRQAEVDALDAKLASDYGKVGPAEFLSRSAALETLRKEIDHERYRTVRENWDIGIRGGIFAVDYDAYCHKGCGFKFEYNFTQDAGR